MSKPDSVFVYLVQSRRVFVNEGDLFNDLGIISGTKGDWGFYDESKESLIEDFCDEYPDLEGDTSRITDDWLLESGYGEVCWETLAVAMSEKESSKLLGGHSGDSQLRVCGVHAIGILADVVSSYRKGGA